MENFSIEWRDLQRALNMHMHLENNGFFQLLDSIGNSAVSEAGLGGEHDHDLELQQNVDKAIREGDLDSVRQAFDAWSQDHLSHLVHEEDVMMPIIPKAGANCIEHGQVVHDRLLASINAPDEFDWTLSWILQKLQSSSNEAQMSEMMVRVFVWGLHYSADEQQWQRWLPIIKENVSASFYQQLVDTFRIDRPGRVGAVGNLQEEFSFLAEDAPKPMPFAVMRNTHEALRASIQEMNDILRVA